MLTMQSKQAQLAKKLRKLCLSRRHFVQAVQSEMDSWRCVFLRKQALQTDERIGITLLIRTARGYNKVEPQTKL
jgi:hypothetical protein